MMDNTYQFVCALTPEEAAERVQALFAKESVEYKAWPRSVITTKTPTPFLSVDRRLYSSNNWVGLNPFAFVSWVEVRCQGDPHGETNITVHVSRGKAVLLTLFWLSVAGIVGIVMPQPAGVIVAAVATGGAWLVNVCLLGDLLVKNEIRRCLNTEPK